MYMRGWYRGLSDTARQWVMFLGLLATNAALLVPYWLAT